MIQDLLNFELSADEIQMCHAAHQEAKRNKDVNAAYKIHAIILLGSGMTCEEVSEVLFLNIDTLANYVKKYKNGGIAELCQTNYLGRQTYLNAEQENQLSAELDRTIYPTTNAVQSYILSNFNLEYSISGVTTDLRSNLAAQFYR